MKKLMIAACAVALAGVAQAYSVDWQIAAKSFEMANGTTHPNGVNVYLVNTSAASWSDWDGLGKTALMALAAGDINAGNIASQSFWAGTATTYQKDDETSVLFKNNYAKVNKTQGTGAGVTTTDDKYAIVIFDSATKSPDAYYIVSAAVDGKGYVSNPEEGVLAGFTAQKFSTDTLSGGWQQVAAVPEPTSGLLLLLGVAGLALRRRRA